jgi:methyltransferase (TIGR00027 family)
MTAAAARAAHMIVDHEPYIFVDPLAATLLGDRAEELIGYHRRSGDHPILAGARAQVTCRARLTEERLAQSGVDQYVILGAGLDSYAYRTTVHMRVFEVDHPASQAWKRQRLAAAGITPGSHVSFVPVDFEHWGALVETLPAYGFQVQRPAMVSWLGVTMYLTTAAIDATLRALSPLARGSELVFDYLVPDELRDERGRLYAEQVAVVAAQRGEPWHTFLTPSRVSAWLGEHGWSTIVHKGQSDFVELAGRSDSLQPSTLAMLAHARR